VDRLEQALSRAERQRSKVAVLVLDIDRFKTLNDNFGHDFGDHVLRTVVGRLTEVLRASDTLARTGGDEFTVVSDVATSEGARVLVNTVGLAFAAPVEVQGRLTKITISAGAALYPDDNHDGDGLRASADKAMYSDKLFRSGLSA
jgi:diguanylate cyclase (GGDEF)-like protein